MEKKTRILFICLLGFLLILILFKFRTKLENFFFFEFNQEKAFKVKAEKLEKYYASFKPFRRWEVDDLKIKAEAALSAEIDSEGNKKFLFRKNPEKILPIASLTKLMTALVAFENYDLLQEVEISPKAAMIKGTPNFLRTGESFYVKDLLYSLLMESNNIAAQALAEAMGEKKFVQLMNQKAKEIGLFHTYFSNPTGLDPNNPKVTPNSSNAEDLIDLSHYFFNQPFLAEILKTEEFDLYETNGIFHHKIKNTNRLLTEYPRILGGKTGQTPLAGECLLIVLKGPRAGFLINVILNSQNRFEEMKKLTDWVYQAYQW